MFLKNLGKKLIVTMLAGTMLLGSCMTTMAANPANYVGLPQGIYYVSDGQTVANIGVYRGPDVWYEIDTNGCLTNWGYVNSNTKADKKRTDSFTEFQYTAIAGKTVYAGYDHDVVIAASPDYLPSDVYYKFNTYVGYRIETAKDNEVINIFSEPWTSLKKEVLEKLAARRDVTLNITYKSPEDGKRYVITIPAGAEVPTDVDYAGFDGFLTGKFGKTAAE